jgi:hypothetical protein
MYCNGSINFEIISEMKRGSELVFGPYIGTPDQIRDGEYTINSKKRIRLHGRKEIDPNTFKRREHQRLITLLHMELQQQSDIRVQRAAETTEIVMWTLCAKRLGLYKDAINCVSRFLRSSPKRLDAPVPEKGVVRMKTNVPSEEPIYYFVGKYMG